MADIDVRCAFDLSFLKPRSFYFFFDVPSLADFIWCGILPIESLFLLLFLYVFVYLLLCSFFVCLFGCLCFQMHPRLLGHWSTWRVSCSSFLTLFSSQDAEIFERYRDATDDQSKSELLSVLKLRYFTPREVANLHGFSSDFGKCYFLFTDACECLPRVFMQRNFPLLQHQQEIKVWFPSNN